MEDPIEAAISGSDVEAHGPLAWIKTNRGLLAINAFAWGSLLFVAYKLWHVA